VIPIRNVYYMLSYAFRVLNEQGYKSIETEEFHNVAELCASILTKGVSLQLKRGLGKEYISETEALSSPRGKIDVTASIKDLSKCVFSNCVEDIVRYINQYQNSSPDGLCIQFIGTDEDFAIFDDVVKKENEYSSKKGKIQSVRSGIYKSADEAIEIIRSAYNRISSEFDDYLPGKEKYEEDSSYICKAEGSGRRKQKAGRERKEKAGEGDIGDFL